VLHPGTACCDVCCRCAVLCCVVGFSLSCSTRCDVTRALHIDNLKRCYVFTGPVAGSVLMESCQDCTFFFAARQIRLHTSLRCDYYLHVLSRPIIEHCSQLRFAYYSLQYPTLRAQLHTAELDKPRARTMWQNVDDFGWHRTQHSPNWSELRREDALTAFPPAADAAVIEELGVALKVGWRSLTCVCLCVGRGWLLALGRVGATLTMAVAGAQADKGAVASVETAAAAVSTNQVEAEVDDEEEEDDEL